MGESFSHMGLQLILLHSIPDTVLAFQAPASPKEAEPH